MLLEEKAALQQRLLRSEAERRTLAEKVEEQRARIEERDRQPEVLAAEARGESPPRSAPII